MLTHVRRRAAARGFFRLQTTLPTARFNWASPSLGPAQQEQSLHTSFTHTTWRDQQAASWEESSCRAMHTRSMHHPTHRSRAACPSCRGALAALAHACMRRQIGHPTVGAQTWAVGAVGQMQRFT